jgi:hypothetical protein
MLSIVPKREFDTRNLDAPGCPGRLRSLGPRGGALGCSDAKQAFPTS